MHPLPRKATLLTVVWIVVVMALFFIAGAFFTDLFLAPGIDDY